ncbi:hypothetical protein IE077_000478 [Cardiosporidium cionae]|uniref:Proteasome component Ecm29 N-terminal domain-containing protein n=1 Tax=Cardiosporidium cionae TaxID=476202 RepID=A0ABQ7J900_9APIC|nr:hypothetical protein IE077_000478 [Cardiosporidium cionae]|eukprot:KAF8820478.1 hypothetical protein IE077_000478 [Cardiosporidium cionae]
MESEEWDTVCIHRKRQEYEASQMRLTLCNDQQFELAAVKVKTFILKRLLKKLVARSQCRDMLLPIVLKEIQVCPDVLKSSLIDIINHMLVRTRSILSVKPPLEKLVDICLEMESGGMEHNALLFRSIVSLFLEIALEREDKTCCLAAASNIIANFNKFKGSFRCYFLYFFILCLKKVDIQALTAEEWVSLFAKTKEVSTPASIDIFICACTEFFLLPVTFETAKSFSGLPVSSAMQWKKALIARKVTAENCTHLKRQLLSFFASMKNIYLSNEHLYIPLLVISCDVEESFQREGDSAVRRIRPSTNFDNEFLVKFIIKILLLEEPQRQILEYLTTVVSSPSVSSTHEKNGCETLATPCNPPLPSSAAAGSLAPLHSSALNSVAEALHPAKLEHPSFLTFDTGGAMSGRKTAVTPTLQIKLMEVLTSSNLCSKGDFFPYCMVIIRDALKAHSLLTCKAILALLSACITRSEKSTLETYGQWILDDLQDNFFHTIEKLADPSISSAYDCIIQLLERVSKTMAFLPIIIPLAIKLFRLLNISEDPLQHTSMSNATLLLRTLLLFLSPSPILQTLHTSMKEGNTSRGNYWIRGSTLPYPYCNTLLATFDRFSLLAVSSERLHAEIVKWSSTVFSCTHPASWFYALRFLQNSMVEFTDLVRPTNRRVHSNEPIDWLSFFPQFMRFASQRLLYDYKRIPHVPHSLAILNDIYAEAITPYHPIAFDWYKWAVEAVVLPEMQTTEKTREVCPYPATMPPVDFIKCVKSMALFVLHGLKQATRVGIVFTPSLEHSAFPMPGDRHDGVNSFMEGCYLLFVFVDPLLSVIAKPNTSLPSTSIPLVETPTASSLPGATEAIDIPVASLYAFTLL